jgi:hypothetical protein
MIVRIQGLLGSAFPNPAIGEDAPFHYVASTAANQGKFRCGNLEILLDSGKIETVLID